MLSNTLVTNEIKNASAAEVEFERLSTGPGSATVFKAVAEVINAKNRMSVSHQHTGSGVNAVRRSLIRFDKEVTNAEGVSGTVSAYVNLVVPEGIISDMTAAKDALAQLMSFLATTGAGTTVLFDCSGNGANVLINETL
jgi:hypothetical protein